MDIKEKIAGYIKEALRALGAEDVPVVVEYTHEISHGDLSSNAAFRVAKVLKKDPLEAAELIKKNLPASMPEIQEVRAISGYNNFDLSRQYFDESLDEILEKKDRYGANNDGQGQKVLTEFISANPTGPLTLANARGGFLGDALSRILEFNGFDVKREYYMNDSAYHNTQIQMLGRSVLSELSILESEKEKQYSGAYIKEVAKKVIKKEPGLKDGKDIFLAGEIAAEIIFKDFIEPTIARMGINYDMVTHENVFYEDGSVQRSADEWTKKKLAYEKEGALWFAVSKHGADEDAVIRRSNGEFTYLAADIVHYMKNIKENRFDSLINVVGADHHGTVKNLAAALSALKLDKGVEHIIIQFVRLTSGGKEVKMSKRAGTFVTVDELLDEVGPDVARFFFLLRSSDSHMDFDLDLAKEQSSKNPVYYVQYAHARVSGILKNAKKKPSKPDWSLLSTNEEQNLIRELLKFEDVVKESCVRRTPHLVAHYTLRVADLFHPFYDSHRVIIDDHDLSNARLTLVLAVKTVLKNSLTLLGVSSPEEM